MSTAKTSIEQGNLDDFFRSHLQLPEVVYETIAEGETSQAYFFDSIDGPRVLRFSKYNDKGFLKDDFAARHFASHDVPA